MFPYASQTVCGVHRSFQRVNHPNLRQMSRVGKVNGTGCLSLLAEQRGSLDDNLKLYV